MASLLDQSFEFISKHENTVKPTYIAYPDGSVWSIGFGNRSYAGEIIDYQEAVNRSRNYIQDDIDILNNEQWFSELNDFQKIAVLDFAYQAGKYGEKFARLKTAIKLNTVNKDSFVTGYENISRVENRWNMWQQLSTNPIIQFASMENFWIVMIIMSIIALIFKFK